MTLAALHCLAAGPGVDDFFPVLLRALVVMAFVGVLIGGVAVLRKRLTEGEGDEASSSFSMGGLRELVRQGKMTQEEFDHAKAAVVDATQKQIARDAAAKAAAERKSGQINPRRRPDRATDGPATADPEADPDPDNGVPPPPGV